MGDVLMSIDKVDNTKLYLNFTSRHLTIFYLWGSVAGHFPDRITHVRAVGQTQSRGGN